MASYVLELIHNCQTLFCNLLPGCSLFYSLETLTYVNSCPLNVAKYTFASYLQCKICITLPLLWLNELINGIVWLWCCVPGRFAELAHFSSLCSSVSKPKHLSCGDTKCAVTQEEGREGGRQRGVVSLKWMAYIWRARLSHVGRCVCLDWGISAVWAWLRVHVSTSGWWLEGDCRLKMVGLSLGNRTALRYVHPDSS